MKNLRKIMKRGDIFGIVSVVMALVLGPFSVNADPVPDTGQTKCYNDTTEIACPQPGEPFYGQDGSYLINPPSYTKLDHIGNELPDHATEWWMVRDNLTGLVWETKAHKDEAPNYADHHDADNVYTWYNTDETANSGNPGTAGDGTDTADVLSALNDAAYGGYSDWRLPTIRELNSLVYHGEHDPAIATAYFPNTVSNSYWSSTNTESAAYEIYFDGGQISSGVKTFSYAVRAVRGNRYGALISWVDNGDGTVTDAATGLMWERKTNDGGVSDKDTTYTWEAALAWVQDLNSANYLGYADWRLPSISELSTLQDHSAINPSVDEAVFPNTMTYPDYWSSTTDHYDPRFAWKAGFYSGSTGYYNKAYGCHVRAVRGGHPTYTGRMNILSPEPGSRWFDGAPMPIAWEDMGLGGKVSIFMSFDGGKTFDEIVSSTPNDGSHVWEITGAASTDNCMLKIVSDASPPGETTTGLFTVANPYAGQTVYLAPPSVPAPANGAAQVPLNTGLSWTGPPESSGGIAYDVFFGTGEGQLPLVAKKQAETVWSAGSLAPGTTYFWKVTGTDGNGAVSDSPVWSFTTENDPADGDADGMPDAWEIANGLDPITNDASADADGDRFVNALEYLDGTRPDNPGSHRALAPVTGRIPDTGQTTSYTDVYGEDADFSINPPAYIKVDANGNFLHDGASSWAMVYDVVTGLYWEAKHGRDGARNYGDPHDADNVYTWYRPSPDENGGYAGIDSYETDTEDVVRALNAANFGGFSDWRIPSIQELFTVIALQSHGPAIDTAYFPNTLSSPYWSSTSSRGDPMQAWSMYFLTGYADTYGCEKYKGRYVRAVRGGAPAPADRFHTNGDGTVTDLATGLMWEPKTDDGGTSDINHAYSWVGALGWVASLNAADYLGYSDWRLPTVKELASIADYARYDPSVDPGAFPGSRAFVYRSATTRAYNTASNWGIYFKDGGSSAIGKTDYFSARAVRGGQPVRPGHVSVSGPAQGSRWMMGDWAPIVWDTAGIDGSVAISISRDGGKTYDTIASATENDGRYDWLVDGPASVNCVIRIAPAGDAEKGSAQGLFSVFYNQGLVPGDINLDRQVNLADVILALSITNDRAAEDALPAGWADSGDVNGDQRVGLAEAVYALRSVSLHFVIDHDGDGYSAYQGDCDDADVAIHPGAAEICGDGIDQDCSGGDDPCPSSGMTGAWAVNHQDTTGQGDWVGNIDIRDDYSVLGQQWHQQLNFPYTASGFAGTVEGQVTGTPDENDSYIVYSDSGHFVYTEHGQAVFTGIWTGPITTAVSGTAVYELVVDGDVDDASNPAGFTGTYTIRFFNTTGDFPDGFQTAGDCQGSRDHDALHIVGGTLNGVPLDTAAPELTVAPGALISGAVTITTHNTRAGAAVFPVGWAWSWEPDHAGGFAEIANWASTGDATFAVTVNKNAPSLPGTYYMSFAGGSQASTAHLFSGKCGAVYPAAADWNNGNDIADFGDAAYARANDAHWIRQPGEGGCVHEPGLAMIKVTVPSPASTFSDSDFLDIVITDVTKNYGSGMYNLKNRITVTNPTDETITLTHVHLFLYSYGDLLSEAACTVADIVDDNGDFRCSGSGTVFDPSEYRVNLAVELNDTLEPGASSVSTETWHTESEHGYAMKVAVGYVDGSGVAHEVSMTE